MLAVFAPQPRWRYEPWRGLFFNFNNRTFVLFTVYKDKVAHATEVQEIQPADIIFSRQIKIHLSSLPLKSRNFNISSFFSDMAI